MKKTYWDAFKKYFKLVTEMSNKYTKGSFEKRVRDDLESTTQKQ